MKKTLVWLLALLLTAALPASAAERFEVTDGVYAITYQQNTLLMK